MSFLLSNKNENEIKEFFRGYIHNLAVFIVEFILILTTGTNITKIKDLVNFKNLQELELLFDKCNVLVCYCGHFLNHEILTSLPLHNPKILLVCIYKPSSHANKMERITIERRERYGAVCISASSTHLLSDLRNIIMHNQEKQIIIGVLNDVYADKRGRAIDIEYNGETIKMFSGIETVGRFLNAQFAYSKIQTDRTNGYTIEFVPLSPVCLDNQTRSYTMAYFNELIKDIQENPSAWMLWGAPSFLGNV